MSRISDTFARCKAEGRAAFIPFIMGGDPNLEICASLLDMLATSGADIIELGIPFSDPMADGPVIQAAGLRALQAGTTVKKILELASQFRAKHATPLVLMGYVNPIYRYGFEHSSPRRGEVGRGAELAPSAQMTSLHSGRISPPPTLPPAGGGNGYAAFARDAAAAGVDGVIIVDLPPEEAAELEQSFTSHDLALIRLIAPTSVPERLPLLTRNASGYLYYVSITGITGAGAANADAVRGAIAAIRSTSTLPVCVGFGIKTAEDVKAMARTGADGIVVGSAIVKQIAESKADLTKLGEYVRSLAAACR